MAYYRRAGSPGASALPSAAAAEPALVAQADPPPAERDGLDRLFLGDA